MRVFFNPSVKHNLPGEEPSKAPLDFHKRLSGYAPTPIIPMDQLARKLGVGRVWVKDESNRYGLPSFKILGAWWAVYRLLVERFGRSMESWDSLQELKVKLEPMRPLSLVAATDGNHGRAVARIASLLGFGAQIFIPAGTVTARVEAIVSEGAQVTLVEGAYEDALEAAFNQQDSRNILLQDITWPGYEVVPRWAVEGYSTIFWEVDDALKAWGEEADLVVAQMGGGAFAAAAVRHYRRGLRNPPRIVAIEPECAASTLASMEAGHIVSVSGPHHSIMSGLNCGTVSAVAWPVLKSGIDCFVSIGDDKVREATRYLAAGGLIAGG